MHPDPKYGNLADDKTIERTASALRENGIDVIVVENGSKAKEKLMELIEENSEIMNMTSVTLDTISASKEILESENSVRNKLNKMDNKQEKQKLGAAPELATGSVHAVTEDGKVLVASATGSQLPAYAYGSAHVIWVVGAQKIVKNLEEGMKRLYEYSLPLEDERARKVYGVGSSVNKILIINKEAAPGRITMIIVKEKLGF